MKADPAPEVDTVIEDTRWDALDLPELAQGAVAATLDHLDLGQSWEVAILACDDATIAGLNTRFRQKPAPTNVLSWPSEERGARVEGARPAPPDPDTPELGDIAISFDTCAAEAHASGRPLRDHATHLLVHATLHLLGYDHVRDGDAPLMEGIETEILARMGLPDPYALQTPTTGKDR